jgi:putative nucleotidyltransferase with HDIG domain
VNVSFTDELQRLPAQPISAMRVLRMVDDPHASTADLARLVETDPALSAQVMRMANSPYYGLSQNVSSAGRAVVLLGFTTVRALAVSGACSLLRHRDQLFPTGFWPHAVTTAVAAAAVARRLGVPANDAFSAGLLHDIGAALLYRRDPVAYQRVLDAADFDPEALLALEQRELGTTHPQLGADAVEAWRFPPGFVRAVRQHHRDPRDVVGTLTRTVIIGEALARVITPTALHEAVRPVRAVLDASGLRNLDPAPLLRDIERELSQLAGFLEIDR